MGQYRGVNHGRLRVAVTAVHHAMTDGDDLPAGLCGLEPFQQGVEGLVVADLFAGNALVGDSGAAAVLGDHSGRQGADPVDLAGNFGLG